MTEQQTILITDAIEPQCIDIFTERGFHVVNRPGVSAEEARQLIGDADALIVRSQTKVTAQMLEGATRLKVIGRAGAGVDNIDVAAATRKGIIVMNTPGGNTIATAEHTVSMMLALARNIPQAHTSLQAGKWERNKFTGSELHAKTLGVVGLGKVGAEVAKRCMAFGMTVVAFDPAQSPESAAKLQVALVSLDELLARSDIITIHAPLMAETKGLLSRATLSKCRDGVRIVNCARGGIVDEQALLEALESGKVAGAALDVFEQEPPTNFALVRHPKVVVTPHLGASTEEAQEKVAVQIAHQIVDLFDGKAVVGSVNADLIRIAMRKELQPYIHLAECLGRIICQMKEGAITALRVGVKGDLLADALPAISAAVLKGLFDRILSEPVNYLNAPVIARDRGMTVELHQGGEDDQYTHLIEVEYRTASEQRRVGGTVFGSQEIRITSVDQFHLEIRPEGYLLMYSNQDRPGMLSAVSRILADAGINIGGLSLGRYGPGTKALTIIALDQSPGDETLAAIGAVNGVADLRSINL
jgi:D-3-phosphoglycerate dehydrogenase